MFSPKERTCIGRKYAEKYKALCDSQQKTVTSSCFFDEFASSFSTREQAKDFNDLTICIAKVVKTALCNAVSHPNGSVHSKIKRTIKDLFVTMDKKPSSNNSDYRNRLNELLVFNWLSECENIEITDVAYRLDNGKDCDFMCKHKDGTNLLIEVMSINNIDLSKQDNAETFSKLIGNKVQTKYKDKTNRLDDINNLRIMPIIKYVEGIEDFAPTLDSTISLPAFTVVKNINDNNIELCLTPIEELKNR